MIFKRIFTILFAIIFVLPLSAAAQQAEHSGKTDMSEIAKEDLKIYNEQRKELGMALFYSFSEMYKESFPKLKELYEKGNPVAAYYYAECLYNAWGTFYSDKPQAEEIFSKAIPRIHSLVFAGDGLVSYTLYQANTSGHGVPVDKKKAMFYLEASIKKGYGLAIFDKAKIQEETGQFAQAFDTYQQASQRGNPEADFRLGLIYETGEKGIKQDYRLAISYYEKAANYGHIKAMANLGNLYYNGLGTPQNLPEALRYFQKAAEKENAAATNSLGVMYLKGEGGLSVNTKRAFAYFMKAAKYGDVTAYNNLGNMYFNGIGIDEDKTKAFDYYYKAAEKENAEAMYKVAFMYEKGIGTVKNQKKADFWYNNLEKNGYDLSDFR